MTDSKIVNSDSQTKRNGVIYKITSPSGKVYIGQSVDHKARFSSYKNLKCQGQLRLYRSFIKYGFDAHTIDIIDQCETQYLDDKEIHYIALFDTYNKGLNMTYGGNSRKVVPMEMREKIRKTVREGGYRHSDEKKERIRAASVLMHKTRSQEVKDKTVRLSRMACAKGIIAFRDGQIVGKYETARDAARDLNCDFKKISLCCKRLRPTHMGYTFCFEKEGELRYKKKTGRLRSVVRLSADEQMMGNYESATQAGRELGLSNKTICYHCTHGGIDKQGNVWAYADKYNAMTPQQK